MSQLREPTVIDVPGVYRVCYETAGDDRGSNPDLVGHVYAGPYVARHPEFARVIADEHGIAGYVLGCPDTRAFEQWCELHWWPALRAQYPATGGEDAGLARLFHDPPRSPYSIVERFPAHLHIDLLPRTQGHGFGRVLIEWLCGELAERGIPGVHLGVSPANDNAIAFYEHLGFTTLERHPEVVWMVREL